jgi:hypothetical protein
MAVQSSTFRRFAPPAPAFCFHARGGVNSARVAATALRPERTPGRNGWGRALPWRADTKSPKGKVSVDEQPLEVDGALLPVDAQRLGEERADNQAGTVRKPALRHQLRRSGVRWRPRRAGRPAPRKRSSRADGRRRPSRAWRRRGRGPRSPIGSRSEGRRDFHHQVLAARPDLPYSDYRPGRRRWKSPRGRLDAPTTWATGSGSREPEMTPAPIAC